MQETVDMVHVNCLSMSNMCALVLPQLLKKRKGVIVNISSIATQGFIGASLYSSTKAYASMFSECLQRTYKDSGKIFQLCNHAYYFFNNLCKPIKTYI